VIAIIGYTIDAFTLLPCFSFVSSCPFDFSHFYISPCLLSLRFFAALMLFFFFAVYAYAIMIYIF